MNEESSSTSDLVTVYLAEYQALRSEVTIHFTFANALVALEVTIIGISAALLGRGSPLFILASMLTSAIWLSYMDHIASVHRIALYVGTRLRGKIEANTGEPVLEWEGWLRKLRSGGVSLGDATRLLSEKGLERTLGLTYASSFYGMTAALFLGYSIQQQLAKPSNIPYLIWSVIVVATMLFGYAVRQARRLEKVIKLFDRALSASF